jgi:transposase
MSLQPSVIEPVPEETARIARAAFPKGNLYLLMRDELGTLFHDLDFAALYPRRGQPAFAPWRLALITIMQFLENLSDRQAAEAVRSRIDWKYALGLELEDSGFDYSVLSNFRARLIENNQQTLLLDRIIELFREKKLLKERGKQRTDSTHVLASIRVMNRLELMIETMRAALNELASVVPEWLRSQAVPEWFERYSTRAEQTRLPSGEKAKTDFAAKVGRDGFLLLALIESEQPQLAQLETVQILKKVWQRHYTHSEDGEINWLKVSEMTKAATAIESPYDTQARYSSKHDIIWTGYKVHLSESCDDGLSHLITNVLTTPATTQDVACTEQVQASLAKRNLSPSRHLVDAGYIDSELLVESQEKYNIELFGPTRYNVSWQAREGGYDSTILIDWENKQAICPEGKQSIYWYPYRTKEQYARDVVKIRFDSRDCTNCKSREKCVRNRSGAGRQVFIPAQKLYQALEKTRSMMSSEEGKEEYKKRAGVEGTLSQGVRRGTIRRSRYRGLEKTHLQEIATATGINILRTVNFLNQKPIAKTRISRFARLAN